MKRLLPFAAALLLAAGCVSHRQRYVVLNPDGTTNVVATISYVSAFHKDEASGMSSTIELPGVHHSLTGENMKLYSDPESIKAFGGAVGEVVNVILKAYGIQPPVTPTIPPLVAP